MTWFGRLCWIFRRRIVLWRWFIRGFIIVCRARVTTTFFSSCKTGNCSLRTQPSPTHGFSQHPSRLYGRCLGRRGRGAAAVHHDHGQSSQRMIAARSGRQPRLKHMYVFMHENSSFGTHTQLRYYGLARSASFFVLSIFMEFGNARGWLKNKGHKPKSGGLLILLLDYLGGAVSFIVWDLLLHDAWYSVYWGGIKDPFRAAAESFIMGDASSMESGISFTHADNLVLQVSVIISYCQQQVPNRTTIW